MTPDPRSARPALTIAALALVAVITVFMTYDLQGSLSFALELRAQKVAAMILVGSGLATAAVLFHTISANRILTPSLIGFDSLYVLIQTSSAFLIGTLAFLSIDERIRFALSLLVMMVFALVLNAVFLRRAADDLPLLILSGIVLGGVFSGVSSLAARLIAPNDYTTLQDQLFASFTTVNEQLLVVSAVGVGAALAITANMHHKLDVVALGRTPAVALGVDVDRTTRTTLVLVAVLVSVPTALVGPVTFLGLLAANAAYQLSRTFRHRVTVPLAAMAASTLLIGAQFVLEELLAFQTRTSIIVGFVGGLVFILLVLNEVRR